MQRVGDVVIEQATRAATEKLQYVLSTREFVNAVYMLESQGTAFISKFKQPFSYLRPRIIRYSLQAPFNLSQKVEILNIQRKALYDEFHANDADLLSVGKESGLIRKGLLAWQHVANVLFVEDDKRPELLIFRFKFNSNETHDCGLFNPRRYLRGYALNRGGLGYIGFNADYFDQCEIEGLIPRKFKTVLHEIGHNVFGLVHPFKHTCITDEQKTTAFSVMNYKIEFDLDGRAILPVSPMLSDVFAAQYIVGVNRSAANGNTIYNLNDYVVPRSAPYKPITAIWDNDGSDTFNAANLQSKDAFIDLRPWSRTNLGDGYVMLGDSVIENVVAGPCKSTIILNAFNNTVDLRYAKEMVTVVVDPAHCGKDIIHQFNVSKDIIYFQQSDVVPSPVCRMRGAGEDTLIEFSTDNVLRLIGVKPKEIRPENIISSATYDVVECENFLNFPQQFYADFIGAFKRGAIILFLTGLTAESLRAYHCNEKQISFALLVGQSLLILLSGSWLSAAGSFVTSVLLKQAGFSSQQSMIAGVFVSEIITACQDESYLVGLTKIPARLAGSGLSYITVSALGRFGLWAQRKIGLQPFGYDSRATTENVYNA